LPQPSVHNPLGMPFVELQSVDSTNNYALARAHAGMAHHGEAFFAHEQVAGKGQRGQRWITQKGENIILSVIADPSPLLLNQQFQLSAAVALAVHDLFSNYAGAEDTKIKWPNDLYWQDRKAGGILVESVIGASGQEKGAWKWAIIGIGININQTRFPEGLKNPVSLKQITGKNFDVVVLAHELCRHLDQRFVQLLQGGFPAIHRAFNERLYKKDSAVKFKKENRVFEAVVQSVTPEGRLRIRHSIEEELGHGSVEWII